MHSKPADGVGTDSRLPVSQKEGREMLGIGPLDDGGAGRQGAVKSVLIKRRRLISALALKTRRYAICVHGPDVIAVFDKRYMLDGLLAWPELRPIDEDWFLGDFENLLRELSAGPTLNEADDELLEWLAINAGAWGNAGLEADPPDDAVAARHSRLYQDSIVFEGSMAEAERFLRGVLTGWIRPIRAGLSP